MTDREDSGWGGGRYSAFAAGSMDHRLAHAIDVVAATYGDKIDIGRKRKSLRKWGDNPNIGTSFEDVWHQGGTETFETTNAIDYLTSSDNGDNQLIQVEGHTISGGLLAFVIQTVTCTGWTPAPLTTPLARVTRVANLGTTDFAGDIYVYKSGNTVTNGVPQTAADIHMKVLAGDNQSAKASTSISSSDYWLLTQFAAGVLKNSTAAAQFDVQIREVASANKVFRTVFSITADSAGISIPFDPPIIVPKNHDYRVRAYASTAAVECYAMSNGYLASVV